MLPTRFRGRERVLRRKEKRGGGGKCYYQDPVLRRIAKRRWDSKKKRIKVTATAGLEGRENSKERKKKITITVKFNACDALKCAEIEEDKKR